MANSLHALFHAIATANGDRELRLRFMDTVGKHFARVGDTPAFSNEELADLSAVCTNLSACLATLQTRQTRFNSSLARRLTPRELEIAELVAHGLTNGEIGEKLWISPNSVKQALKRMFRKLEVSARAEMVAKL